MSTVEKSIRLYAWITNYQTFRVVQGEVNSRTFNIELFGTSTPVNLTNCMVMLYATKPDSTKIYVQCEVVDAKNGLIKATVSEQMCAVAGKVDCWIQVVSETGTDLRFEGMNIEVGDCSLAASVESSDDMQLFLQQISEIIALKKEITNARLGCANLQEKESSQDEALTNLETALRAEIHQLSGGSFDERLVKIGTTSDLKSYRSAVEVGETKIFLINDSVGTELKDTEYGIYTGNISRSNLVNERLIVQKISTSLCYYKYEYDRLENDSLKSCFCSGRTNTAYSNSKTVFYGEHVYEESSSSDSEVSSVDNYVFCGSVDFNYQGGGSGLLKSSDIMNKLANKGCSPYKEGTYYFSLNVNNYDTFSYLDLITMYNSSVGNFSVVPITSNALIKLVIDNSKSKSASLYIIGSTSDGPQYVKAIGPVQGGCFDLDEIEVGTLTSYEESNLFEGCYFHH